MFVNQQNQQQKQDLANVQSTLKNVYTIQQQPEFQQLIQYLQRSFLHFNQQLDRDIHQPVKLNSSTFDSFRHQSQNIILKNQKLKEKIIIIKARLQQLQNFSDTFKPAQNFQQRENIQKIKMFSTQIKGKILALRQKRYINKEAIIRQDDPTSVRSERRPNQKMIPLQISMEEIKKGTEYMARSLITIKHDMEVTQKYVKVNDSLNSKK